MLTLIPCSLFDTVLYCNRFDHVSFCVERSSCSASAYSLSKGEVMDSSSISASTRPRTLESRQRRRERDWAALRGTPDSEELVRLKDWPQRLQSRGGQIGEIERSSEWKTLIGLRDSRLSSLIWEPETNKDTEINILSFLINEHFTALDVPMYVTCSKAEFPCLKVNLQSGECLWVWQYVAIN